MHALAAALFFLAFVSWTGAFVPSFIGAGLFAVHPVAVEAVAMPSGRGLILAGIFVALSLLLYTLHARQRAERGASAQLYLSLCAFVLAVLSHPAAVVFALVPLLLTPDPSDENESRPLPGERLLFLVVGLVAGGVALFLAPASELGFVDRLIGGVAGLGHGVRNAIAPHWVSPFYPNAALSGGSAFGLVSLVGLAALVVVSALGFARRASAQAFFCAILGW